MDENLEGVSRQKTEKLFHDKLAAGEHKISPFFKLGVSDYAVKRLLEKLGDVRGKKVLELGCGSGWLSLMLAELGASVWACDISIDALKKRAKTSRSEVFRRVHKLQTSSENLSLKTGTFDYVVGNAVLHHTDMDRASREIQRVLKEGGSAIFVEPLGHNFLINAYRRRTPHLHSVDERPLLAQDIKRLSAVFRRVDHEEMYFLALASFVFNLAIRNDRLFLGTLNLLHRADEIFLRSLPWFRKYSWFSLIAMEK